MNKGKVINKPLEARKASPLLVSVSAVILGMLAASSYWSSGKTP